MPDDSVKKNIIVALGVCIVCSVLVSTTAVSLQAIQERNRKADRIENILEAAGLTHDNGDIQAIYREKVRPEMIDLRTGDRVPEGEFNEFINIDKFDIKKISGSRVYGMSIPDTMDIAKIKRMPKFMVVYFVLEEGKPARIVLPVYGKGLWSTMYGFIALDMNLEAVKGITFYEHGETPGLGGEVDNPRWKKSWEGKQVFDDQGNVEIHVIKGMVDRSRPDARYEIDGLSGATLTSRGVSSLVRFWLGAQGYGTFLNRLRENVHG